MQADNHVPVSLDKEYKLKFSTPEFLLVQSCFDISGSGQGIWRITG
jgi:hypothetical protein